MKEYSEVPYIISGKDLDYLTDMFNWHYGIYKNNLDSINSISDLKLKNAIKTVNKNIYGFMEDIIKILEESPNEDL